MNLDYRPCGACGALIDIEVGCGHWKPGLSRHTRTIASRRRDALLQEAVERTRAARAAVDEFRRTMNRAVTG